MIKRIGKRFSRSFKRFWISFICFVIAAMQQLVLTDQYENVQIFFAKNALFAFTCGVLFALAQLFYERLIPLDQANGQIDSEKNWLGFNKLRLIIYSAALALSTLALFFIYNNFGFRNDGTVLDERLSYLLIFLVLCGLLLITITSQLITPKFYLSTILWIISMGVVIALSYIPILIILVGGSKGGEPGFVSTHLVIGIFLYAVFPISLFLLTPSWPKARHKLVKIFTYIMAVATVIGFIYIGFFKTTPGNIGDYLNLLEDNGYLFNGEIIQQADSSYEVRHEIEERTERLLLTNKHQQIPFLNKYDWHSSEGYSPYYDNNYFQEIFGFSPHTYNNYYQTDSMSYNTVLHNEAGIYLNELDIHNHDFVLFLSSLKYSSKSDDFKTWTFTANDGNEYRIEFTPYLDGNLIIDLLDSNNQSQLQLQSKDIYQTAEPYMSEDEHFNLPDEVFHYQVENDLASMDIIFNHLSVNASYRSINGNDVYITVDIYNDNDPINEINYQLTHPNWGVNLPINAIIAEVDNLAQKQEEYQKESLYYGTIPIANNDTTYHIEFDQESSSDDIFINLYDDNEEILLSESLNISTISRSFYDVTKENLLDKPYYFENDSYSIHLLPHQTGFEAESYSGLIVIQENN